MGWARNWVGAFRTGGSSSIPSLHSSSGTQKFETRSRPVLSNTVATFHMCLLESKAKRRNKNIKLSSLILRALFPELHCHRPPVATLSERRVGTRPSQGQLPGSALGTGPGISFAGPLTRCPPDLSALWGRHLYHRTR